MCNLTIRTHCCGIHNSTSHLELCTIRATSPGSEDLPASSCPYFSRITSAPHYASTNPPTPPRPSCTACTTLLAAAEGEFSPLTSKWKAAIEYTDIHGGASCEHRTGAILTSPAFRGFMVGGVVPNNSSPAPRWSRDKSLVPNAVTAVDIETFVSRHHAIFNSSSSSSHPRDRSGHRTRKLVLGLWIAPATDGRGNVVYDPRGRAQERLYVDVSEAFASQFRALATSLGRRELGIFMITDDYRDGFRVCTRPGSRVERALRGAMVGGNEGIADELLRRLGMEGEEEEEEEEERVSVDERWAWGVDGLDRRGDHFGGDGRSKEDQGEELK